VRNFRLQISIDCTAIDEPSHLIFAHGVLASNFLYLSIRLCHTKDDFSASLSAAINHFSDSTCIDFIAGTDGIIICFVDKGEGQNTLFLQIRFVDPSE